MAAAAASGQTLGELELGLMSRVTATLAARGKSVMVWQGMYDVHGDALPKDVAVEPWECWGGLADAALVRASAEGRGVVQSQCWCDAVDAPAAASAASVSAVCIAVVAIVHALRQSL
jgi:hypothetical protein